MFHLFDDPILSDHIKSLQQKLAPDRRQSKESNLYYGICSGWNNQRAFGWITSDGPVEGVPDKEIFCHKSGLPKGMPSLERGVRVEFTTRPSRAVGKPPEAKIIRVLDPVAEAA